MSEPAWKRLGLKVKAVISHDPLAVVTRDDRIENKEKKTQKIDEKKKDRENKSEFKKRKLTQDNNNNNKDKKPPKRAKIPKSERIENNNVVKDQLKYMRQFSTDHDNWKFSKQKQNWIIKNIRTIPDEYEEDMTKYLLSVQGGSRDRIVQDMKNVVNEWNMMVLAAEEQMKKDLEENDNDNDNDDDDDKEEERKDLNKANKANKKEAKKGKKDVKKQDKKEVVDYDYAVRACSLYKAFTGDDLSMSGIEDSPEKELDVKLIEETVDVDQLT
jgi:hypothetical protein